SSSGRCGSAATRSCGRSLPRSHVSANGCRLPLHRNITKRSRRLRSCNIAGRVLISRSQRGYAAAMAQIILDHVEKAYSGGVKAVDDLSLDIQDGGFMVLVGPSGCGKSTALRSIAGLEEITAGTISIGDRIVNDLPPKDRDIAMVFQNYALYPHMTVEQNLAFGRHVARTP